jgi:DNA-binding transcriptional ArsR family regulator
MTSGLSQLSLRGESNGRIGGDADTVDCERVFTALEDPDCRTLLEATADEALTAQELTDRCDIPRSTTYRKVELLAEAGLLEEQVRLRADGKHASEYRRAFDGLVVSMDAGELEVDLEVNASGPTPVGAD